MDNAEIRTQDIKDISDFVRIPFITKYELDNHINSEELFDKLRNDPR